MSRAVVRKNLQLSDVREISGKGIMIANIKILLLILTGAVFVYLFNFPLSNTIYYSAVFIAFIRSRNNVFWIAFLLILMFNPWGLFYYRIYNWMIPVTSTISIPYSSFLGVALVLKARLKFHSPYFRYKDHLSGFYKVFGFYTIFLLLLSLVFGHTPASMYKIVLFLPSLLIFLYIPRLFNYRELINLNKIIFMFVIIHTSGVFLDIVTNGVLIGSLTFGKQITGAIFTDEIIRILGGIGLNLYAMVTALFYFIRKEPAFKKQYLMVIVILAYITILASATRGWMIASTVLILTSLVYSTMHKAVNVKTLVGALFVVMLIILLIPGNVRTNLSASFQRFLTIEAIAEGDLTARGTVARLTERGPRTLTKFSESPVFGFGYSRVTEDYYDGHVGNHSLLLMGGITGLLIVYITITALIIHLLRQDLGRNGRGIFVFSIALLSVMIIHSTSRAMVSFYFPADSAFMIALFFSHVNAVKTESIKAELQKINEA